MIEPKVIRDDRPLRWRIWWTFGFTPILWLLRFVPAAEWRKEHWVWHLDTWAMDHIGRRRSVLAEGTPGAFSGQEAEK